MVQCNLFCTTIEGDPDAFCNVSRDPHEKSNQEKKGFPSEPQHSRRRLLHGCNSCGVGHAGKIFALDHVVRCGFLGANLAMSIAWKIAKIFLSYL